MKSIIDLIDPLTETHGEEFDIRNIKENGA